MPGGAELGGGGVGRASQPGLRVGGRDVGVVGAALAVPGDLGVARHFVETSAPAATDLPTECQATSGLGL